ncbi:MAG: NADH-quinone oxidoreductase subunit A [Archaeoglobus sp.]|nr:NADH-quinone oxidoreductase subunit A [Archaeoglobus sp.]
MGDNIIIIGALIVVSLVIDGAILVLSKILPRYKKSEIKILRYEAGNIPIRNPKKRIPMQYFGYMYMFMAVEPVIILLLVLAVFAGLSFFILLAVAAIAFIPAIYFGYMLTLEMAYRRVAYE